MRTSLTRVFSVSLLAVLLSCGCRPPDQRLQKLAETSLEQQSRQNEAIAENSREIAEATRQLVQADAETRQQVIEANRELQTQIATTNERLDQARDQVEAERRSIAAQRQRDPIVAEAIGGFGLILATLIPLIVAGILLFLVQQTGPDESAVSELLIAEVAREPARLMVPEIPHLGAADSTSSSSSA